MIFDMKKGFSLAEVLICLMIVGMIAAMTIPSIVFRYQEQITVTKLQKTYSTLSNSYKMLRSVYGPPEFWSEYVSSSERDSSIFKNKFKQFLKVMHDCEYDKNHLCLTLNKYTTFSGGSYRLI